MGILDKIKDKAADLARTHDEKIDSTVDRAAEVFNRKTSGKHAGKVQGLAERAKSAVDDLGRAPSGGTASDPEPPPAPPSGPSAGPPPAPPAGPPPGP
jgi:hypothetical protein